MKKKIKLFDPLIDKNEERELIRVLKSGFWASGSGAGKVSKFETLFNRYVGSKSCVSVNSGTSALHLAISLFDVKNTEIIIPSLSFVSTAHAVLYNNAKPVFVDVDPETLCIDPREIKKKISKKTSCILPVHFGGMAANIDEILRICKNEHISLIEDAAHAAGSKYNGKLIGTHGHAVCFSFHPVKNLAMPNGGAITLNGKKSNINSKLLKIRRWCGITNRQGTKYDVSELGYNFYLNEFSAVIGIAQLKKLDALNKKRKEIAKKYSTLINLDDKMPFNRECSYHLFWIRVKNRNSFMQKMNNVGIETGIHYYPIHKMSFYKGKTSLPNTEKIAQEIVSIPIHPNLTKKDVNYIIEKINRFL